MIALEKLIILLIISSKNDQYGNLSIAIFYKNC